MIAILADIHGNYPALKAVLEDVERIGCEKIISLGDVAGYYCFINECIEALMARKVANVMGNHDHYIVTETDCPRSNSANLCLEHQRSVLSKENLDFLKRSVCEIKFDDLWMVHGGWENPLDEYLYHVSEEYFSGRAGRFFFSGHTHVQTVVPLGRQLYCNPGSVGQPRDGDPRAAYALFDGKKVILQRVAYDIAAVGVGMRAAGFSQRLFPDLV
ncbi:MAG: metallophosphatase family protein, partial [Desulfuromonadales bacterium]|nr:metallophosphatase family protein [Desulfuromonadales bacterium]